MKTLPVFFVTTALILAVGCKSSSTTPNSGSVKIPGVGSFYTFYEIALDNNGVIQSTDTLTMKIVQENYPHGGYNDVAEVLSTTTGNAGGVSNSFYRFLANGDVMLDVLSQGQGAGNDPPLWLTLPFSSRTPESATLDTTIVFNTEIDNDTLAYSAQFRGTETLGVPGGTMSMNEVTFNNVISLYSNVGNNETGAYSTVMNYSPANGVFGGSNDVSNISDGTEQLLYHQTLIAYSVK